MQSSSAEKQRSVRTPGRHRLQQFPERSLLQYFGGMSRSAGGAGAPAAYNFQLCTDSLLERLVLMSAMGPQRSGEQTAGQMAADDCSCWMTEACQTADGQAVRHPDGDRSQLVRSMMSLPHDQQRCYERSLFESLANTECCRSMQPR